MKTVKGWSIEEFLLAARPKLMRAFIGSLGQDRADEALAVAFAWAVEHEARLATMANPTGYLYRVGVTRSTPPKEPMQLPAMVSVGLPDFEPRLIPALLKLSQSQRTAVWLIYGCGWTYPAAAEAMDIGAPTVGTHARRGLAALRREMEETHE